RPQRIDLLAHFHGAEFGGVGTAGTAGHHDADDQHADFAQHKHADHVDNVYVGAEFAEVKDALLGEDGADEHGNQQNDRHRLPSHALEMVDHRGEAEGPRAQR